MKCVFDSSHTSLPDRLYPAAETLRHTSILDGSISYLWWIINTHLNVSSYLCVTMGKTSLHNTSRGVQTYKNEQSRITDHIGCTRRGQTKQKHNTLCGRHHYTQTNTNNVSKTWVLRQTTGRKDEMYTCCFSLHYVSKGDTILLLLWCLLSWYVLIRQYSEIAIIRGVLIFVDFVDII